MNKRRDKIHFLKGLLKGERNLSEIGFPPVIMFVSANGASYKYKNSGDVLSGDEVQKYQEYINNLPKVKFNVTHYREHEKD